MPKLPSCIHDAGVLGNAGEQLTQQYHPNDGRRDVVGCILCGPFKLVGRAQGTMLTPQGMAGSTWEEK
jgi:hypothetical protein